MSFRRTALLLLAALVIVSVAAAQDDHLWVGPNVNMVSGTTWPDGDPFLQRQNEPSIAVSTRSSMRLMGFTNDYRSVDLPGLPVGKETGDAWLGVYKSLDGGMTWRSTLLPGYPQDLGSASPIYGYDAGADPVVRAGTHGLFYLTGIIFDRGEFARSALFLTRYMDLDNRESGDPVEYIDTEIIKANLPGDAFIDKPWLAVDVPRAGAQSVQIEVFQDGSPVYQTVQCGNVYVAWAEIYGVAPNQRSTIMFSKSVDCGTTWSSPIPLSVPDTMNQGVSMAVSPDTGDIWLAWRQFETDPTFLVCASGGGYWKTHPEEWPLAEFVMGGVLYTKAEALDILNWSKGGDATYILAKQLIPAKLNAADYLLVGELQDLIDAADAWLVANPLGSKPTGAVKAEGLALKDELESFNNGEWATEGCTTSVLTPGTGNAIVSVRSTDAGFSFGPPSEVSTILPFEQATTPYSFRTNAYPTITVDNAQPFNRAYIAWATRGLAIPRDDDVEGDARIVVSTSTDGMTWTIPDPIDQPELPGHQIVPSITFAGGKIVLVYYDLRRDMSGVFDRFIADFPVLTAYRHTVDVQAAQADPADFPEFTQYNVAPGRPSDQVSRYLFLADYPGIPGDPAYTDTPDYIQMKYNPPNLTIYLDGTRPFFGDYVDVAASPAFLPNPDGSWRFNTEPEDGAAFHAAWTDNRDIEAPYDGDWSNYVVPGSGGQSVFDANQTVPACDQVPDAEGQTKIRDQNTYSARLTSGLFVGSPGGSRPIGSLQRAFVVTVQNDSEEVKIFRLEIEAPPDVTASFEQFSANPALDLQIAPFSGATRTVFVTSSIEDDARAVSVNVTELGGDGLTGSVLLNGDPSSPPPADTGLLTAETYTPAMMNRTLENPAMMNPAMMNLAMMNLAMMNPAMMNLAMMNPAMMNLAMMNLAMMNPAMMNLAMMNPAMMNPAMMNLAMMNPAMMNPAMMNPAMMNLAMMNPAMMNTPIDEVTWELKNDGTATAGFAFNLLGDGAPDPALGEFVYQLFIYREYKTPAADGCELTEAVQQQELVNVLNPEILDRNDPGQIPDLFDPDNPDTGLDNPTFYLDPGDTAYATLLIVDLDPLAGDDFGAEDVWAAVVAQAVNTDDAANGETKPDYDTDFLIITTTSLPDATAGVLYSLQLTSTDGLGAKTWSLVPGPNDPPGSLSLGIDGHLSGTVTAGGTYQLTFQVFDGYETDQTTLSLLVNEATAATPTAPVATPIGGLVETPVTVLVTDGNGDPLGGYQVTLQLAANSNGASAHNNVAQTAGDGVATFDQLWFDRIGDDLELVAEVALSGGVTVATAPSDPFDVSPLVVTITADDGPGSLRRCLENANRNVGYHDIISFDTTGPLPHRITVASPLPHVSDPVTIDGMTHPQYGDEPVVYLDGAAAGPDADGFRVYADNTEILGMGFVNYSFAGIYIIYTSDVRVENNRIGTDGTTALGNDDAGIYVVQSTGTVVTGNLVSGNTDYGVVLADCTNAEVSSNRIGTDATGTAALPNGADGVLIYISNDPTSHGNTVSNNLISGNASHGITLGQGANNNTVAGNLIGTEVSGNSALPNAQSGIFASETNSNTIGGTTPADRNVISGNGINGVELYNTGGTTILGNFIGTIATGTAALSNASRGVFIWGASSGNIVGGPNPGDRNTISGNGGGIHVAAASNVVEGNFVGTDVTGTSAITSTSTGIVLIGSTSINNMVRGNVASGNANGIALAGGANANQVHGNFIGTDLTGTVAIGNLQSGVHVQDSDTMINQIGGLALGQGNVISGNIDGILLTGGCLANFVMGNRIGTNSDGTTALGNANSGITIKGGAQTNFIGGIEVERRNIISGNTYGVLFDGAGGNVLEGNFIGTDATGTNSIGNTFGGIVMQNSADSTLRSNLISGNTGTVGIRLGTGTTDMMIVGNTIGTNVDETAALPNHTGIRLEGGTQGNTIGITGNGNVIAGNTNSGIYSWIGDAIQNTTIEANWIGTNRYLDPGLGNLYGGIRLRDTTNTRVLDNFAMFNGSPGGWSGISLWDTSGGQVTGNVASGNTGSGIDLGGATTGVLVQDNLVGTTADGLSALGNGYDGINLYGGPGLTLNTIQGNLVSANRWGIVIWYFPNPVGPTLNTVRGNTIGLDATLTTALPNQIGVFLRDGAHDNMVGGSVANANIISGNTGAGVAVGVDLSDTGTYGNAILSNSIYGNGGLGVDIADNGVTPNDAGDGDGGPNDLVNFPVLTAAVYDGISATNVTGTVNSLPGVTLWIQFYASPACDPSGYGEGQSYLGQMQVITDGGGNAPFSYSLPTGPGGQITATSSTSPFAGGHTSEFSACVPVT